MKNAIFQALADHISDPVFLIDLDATSVPGKIVYANTAAERLYGYSAEELVGCSISSLMEPSLLDRESNRLACYFSPEIFSFESRYQRANGTMIPVEVSSRMVELNGHRIGVTVHRDLTNRVLANQALKESEARLQAFMDHNPAVVFMKDRTGRMLYYNRTFERTFHVTPEQWRGKTDEQLWPAEVAAALREVDAEVLRSGTQRELIELIPHADGMHEWLVQKFPLLDSNGTPHILCGVAVDVSALHRTQEELRMSREQYRMLMEQAADGFLVTDQAGNILETNEAFSQIIRTPREHLIGANMFELVTPNEKPRLQSMVFRLVAGEMVRETWRVELPGMPLIVIEVNAKALSDGRLQAIVRDATERHQAEERERIRQAELNHVARLSTLGQMVAGIAHEMSQPLYAITNYANAALEVLAKAEIGLQPAVGLDHAHLVEWLKAVSTQSMRAGQVIRRLSNFARQSPIQRLPANPNQLVRDAVELLNAELQRLQIQVEYQLDPDLPAVAAEPILIQQVLVNLVRNACEAVGTLEVPRRRILIGTRQTAELVEFSVSDAGPGIDPTVLKQMFDSFFTTKPTGMGLGLAISRSIVESHLGRLWAENNPDQGATFRFTLPLPNNYGVTN